MRTSFALLALLWLTSIACADVQPTTSLHIGGSYTAILDDYVQDGEPAGFGPELELAVGARFHPRWSASVVAAFGQFTQTLGFENVAMNGLDQVDTTYRHIMIGGSVTFRPIPQLLLGATIGRAFVTEIDPFEGAQNVEFRSTLVGLDLGLVLYERVPLTVQLSIGLGLNVDPDYDHSLLAYVPFSLGLAWN
jgi:hypothetical protein